MKLNTVYFAENLEFLRELNSEYIDLIYIDPPFYSGVDYKEFNDKWNSLEDYLDFMKMRIKEIYRVLKDSGSYYCHCDANAVFVLKLLSDSIFGRKFFRREIIWNVGSVSGFKSQVKGWVRQHIQSCITQNLINTPSINNMSHIRKNILKKCFDIKTKMDDSIENGAVANNT